MRLASFRSFTWRQVVMADLRKTPWFLLLILRILKVHSTLFLISEITEDRKQTTDTTAFRNDDMICQCFKLCYNGCTMILAQVRGHMLLMKDIGHNIQHMHAIRGLTRKKYIKKICYNDMTQRIRTWRNNPVMGYHRPVETLC